ncbi:MAG: PD-(D/E)XK nuclease-like domain-containing protein, partial [Candidatus Heimdallarchaeota archaeon]|nr:PD-(D/E)XK nuclease-like domain-containing protein [Candidatus Heimdallarchaeota archaeon]
MVNPIHKQVIHLEEKDLENFKPEVGNIYSGLPNDQYHSFAEFESSTTVKELNVSLKHREDMEFKKTDAMAFGALFHDAMEALRTGKELSELSAVIDSYGKSKKSDAITFIEKYYPIVKLGDHWDVDDLGIKSRTDLHEIAEQIEKKFLDGKQKVTTENFDRSELMVEAIKNHPTAGKIIELKGMAELSFFTEVEIDIDGEMIPIKIRVRPDDLIEFEDEIWIIDWKSIGEYATEKNIKKALWKYRYDIQAAMYQDALIRFTDKPVHFRFVFAESVKPAKEKVRIVELPDWDLLAGWEDYRKALKRKAEFINDQSIWKGFDIPEDGIDIIQMRS